MITMRQLQALVLAGTIAHTSHVAAGSLPRGVGPEFVKFYADKPTFTCIGHPSITLASAQVNDNSCDCPDGSDEPGTPACAYLDPLSPPQPLAGSLTGTTNTTAALPGFWCANAGHIGAYLPFAHVNDGVCDYELCCDGTEEFRDPETAGGTRCPDRCGDIGKAYRKAEDEKRARKERAAKKRRTLAKESRQARRQVEAKVAGLRAEIVTLTAKRDELQAKLDEVERAERGKVVKGGEGEGKLGVLVGLAKTRVKELRDTLDRVLDQRDDARDKVEKLESMLRKLREEYNPNFNDEGVKQTVKAWEDYAAGLETDKKPPQLADSEILDVLKEDSETNGVNWKEFDDAELTDTDILYSLEAYMPPFLRTFVHDKLNLARVWLIENGVLADNPTGAHESRLVTAARESRDAAVRDLEARQSDAATQQADLDKDYGADDIFRALRGRCVSLDTGEYDYELCWLDKTMQKSKKGHGHTNMGNFARIDTAEADDEEPADGRGLGKGSRLVLRYEHGQGCWNGPQRRTDVWLACAENDEVWRVSEEEKCVYKMEVGTPAACEDVHEPGVQTKDEL